MIFFRYTCVVTKLANTDENAVIESTAGQHANGKSNADIQIFKMTWERESTHLPNGIGRTYPNLLILQVEYCLLKFISRRNFKDMKKLTVLALQANQITDFPKDTFWDLKNVMKVDLSRNNLIYLQPNLFVDMLKLETFHAHFNSLEYLDGRLFRRNLNLKTATFEYNKITVIAIDFNKLSHIQELNFRDNVCINLKFPDNNLAELIGHIEKHCNEALKLSVSKN